MMQNYFTVSGETENTIIIERSKFICSIKAIRDELEAKAFVEEVKKRHVLANHYCYAYVADEKGLVQKFSDAGEPQGTAGLPMLEVLKNKKIRKVVAVVTRYFGGIKLGTGGLTRAYSGSVADCLKRAKILNMCDALFVTLNLDYDKYSRILKHLNVPEIVICSTTFDNGVCVELAVRSDEAEDFIKKITDLFNGKIGCIVKGNGFQAFKD